MVLWLKALLPGKCPNLKEVNRLIGFVLLRVCDSYLISASIDYWVNWRFERLTRSARGELYVSPLHSVKLFPLLPLGALLNHAIPVRELTLRM